MRRCSARLSGSLLHPTPIVPFPAVRIASTQSSSARCGDLRCQNRVIRTLGVSHLVDRHAIDTKDASLLPGQTAVALMASISSSPSSIPNLCREHVGSRLVQVIPHESLLTYLPFPFPLAGLPQTLGPLAPGPSSQHGPHRHCLGSRQHCLHQGASLEAVMFESCVISHKRVSRDGSSATPGQPDPGLYCSRHLSCCRRPAQPDSFALQSKTSKRSWGALSSDRGGHRSCPGRA